MKKLNLVFVLFLITSSAQAIQSLTFTHIADPNYRPIERKFVGNQWEDSRVPCNSYNPKFAPSLCYSKGYSDLLEPNQLQNENQNAKDAFEVRMKAFSDLISIYPEETKISHKNLVAELATDTEFTDLLAKQLVKDLRETED